jgi:hypothetical protein
VKIDVSKVAFCRAGSCLTFGVVPPAWGQKGLLVRTMRSDRSGREVFRLSMVREGRAESCAIDATPARCSMVGRSGSIDLALPAVDAARLRGRGAALRLEAIAARGVHAVPVGGGAWQVNVPASGVQYLLTPRRGGLRVEDGRRVDDRPRGGRTAPAAPEPFSAEFVPGPDGRFEGAIEEFLTTPARRGLTGSFDEAVRSGHDAWTSWRKRLPPPPARYRAAAEQAMYVNYSAIVGPAGLLRRPTMLMSRNWMTHCWSWDHAFNAMPCARHDPRAAWDQFMTPFDFQDERGALPDAVSPTDVWWNFCKPPIHGWALSRMMRRRGLLTGERAREIYPRLVRWTEWWMRERDHDGDGLPEYHHGNDSGWDNATVFDGGYPVAGPDLAAFLVLQMDALALLARRLRLLRDAARWRRDADALLRRLVARLWDGRRFRARKAFGGDPFPEGDSLINAMPIVLGTRLPFAIRTRLADALAPDGRFVTRFGPATESPSSPLYRAGAYWRGPVWAPTTLIAVDGLARAGYPAQAREIARRFCETCRTAGTFAENFDARTGAPLCDPSYTWTSSVFLDLVYGFLG